MSAYTREQIAEVLRLHGAWLRGEPDGVRAVLRGADLGDADLRDADLRGADLDLSAWPLSCGGTGAVLDDRALCQLAYHAYQQDYSGCDAALRACLEAIRPLAERFHAEYRTDSIGAREAYCAPPGTDNERKD